QEALGRAIDQDRHGDEIAAGHLFQVDRVGDQRRAAARRESRLVQPHQGEASGKHMLMHDVLWGLRPAARPTQLATARPARRSGCRPASGADFASAQGFRWSISENASRLHAPYDHGGQSAGSVPERGISTSRKHESACQWVTYSGRSVTCRTPIILEYY